MYVHAAANSTATASAKAQQEEATMDTEIVTTTSTRNGSHQLVLRRISANVLLGARNVSTTRSTCESPLVSEPPTPLTRTSSISTLLNCTA